MDQQKGRKMNFISTEVLRDALKKHLEALKEEDGTSAMKEVRQLYGENAGSELFIHLPDLCNFPAAAINFIRTRLPSFYAGAVREIDGEILVICRTNGVPFLHTKAEELFERVLSFLHSPIPGKVMFLEGIPLILTNNDTVSAGMDYAVTRIEFTLKELAGM